MPEFGEIEEAIKAQFPGESAEKGDGQISTTVEALGGLVAEFGSLAAGQKKDTHYTRPYDYTQR